MAERQKLRERSMDRADCEVIRGNAPPGTPNKHIRCPNNLFTQSGRFVVEHIRDGKKIAEYSMKNGITNQGLNDNLDVAFDSGTQKTAWYMGLINLTGFTALDATDIYDDIDQAGNGWDTFQSYTDANNADSAVTRPEWPPDAPSGQSITNSTTQAIYDITAAGTVKGIFIVGGTNAQTKGDHTAAGNILWSTALFSGGDVVVAISDQLKVTYTVNAAAS
ncbi:MAG: hypothetical protein ACYSW6_10965 [Planctomycetota bacterium]|jgi:hypothetical protein